MGLSCEENAIAEPDRIYSFDFGGETYRLVLNNAAKRSMERACSDVGLSFADIVFRVEQRLTGDSTAFTAALYGLTRKHAAQKIRHMGEADDLMDRLEAATESSGDSEAGEELYVSVTAAVASCLFGQDTERWLKILHGENPDEEAEGSGPADDDTEGAASDESGGEDPERGTEAPKAVKASAEGKSSKKRSPSRSGAGKSS